MKNCPLSSTRKMYWSTFSSGGGGGTGSVCSSGTRTAISFSISGVSTMKMMSSTSTMSTSGVMLMSERGPFPTPTAPAMVRPSLLLLFGRQGHALQLGLRGAVEDGANLPVLGLDVRLHHDRLELRGSVAEVGLQLVERDRGLVLLPEDLALLGHRDEHRVATLAARGGVHRLGQLDMLAALEHRSHHHADDEQHQHHVHERRDVDVRGHRAAVATDVHRHG